MPVVLSKKELQEVLDRMAGTTKNIGQLLYGSGLRVSRAASFPKCALIQVTTHNPIFAQIPDREAVSACTRLLSRLLSMLQTPCVEISGYRLLLVPEL